MAVIVQGEVLIDGAGEGSLFRMAKPISFWGGVDPSTGRVTDPRHPDHGKCVADTVLALSETIGSSSSSAVMLELIAAGLAPRALLLGRPDAILSLGVVVAREMGVGSIPVLRVAIESLPQSGYARVRDGGEIAFES
jgi:predicted aconitase with swiveling domain